MALVTTTLATFEGCIARLRYDDVTGAVEEIEVENQTGRNVRLVVGSSTRQFEVTLGAGSQSRSIPNNVRSRMDMLTDFFFNIGPV